MSNWPYPDKPGVPLNPEKDGFHWIKGWNETPFVAEWFVDQSEDFGGYYGWHDGADNPQGIVAQGWSYLGPCLMPSEVAAQVEQARRQGAEAMREAAARVVDRTPTTDGLAAQTAIWRIRALRKVHNLSGERK